MLYGRRVKLSQVKFNVKKLKNKSLSFSENGTAWDTTKHRDHSGK
jgi:hypothetical protein